MKKLLDSKTLGLCHHKEQVAHPVFREHRTYISNCRNILIKMPHMLISQASNTELTLQGAVRVKPSISVRLSDFTYPLLPPLHNSSQLYPFRHPL